MNPDNSLNKSPETKNLADDPAIVKGVLKKLDSYIGWIFPSTAKATEPDEPVWPNRTRAFMPSVDGKILEGRGTSDFVPKVLNRVLLVRGRDAAMRDAVVAFLRQIGLAPVLTQDGENATKPIAQKAIDFKNIPFAIVLLSADDLVYDHQGKPADAHARSDQKTVFELGFWTGKLGRNNVLALYYDQKNFRRPTDYFDVPYLAFDKAGIWKAEMVQRLKQAGLHVNNHS